MWFHHASGAYFFIWMLGCYSGITEAFNIATKGSLLISSPTSYNGGRSSYFGYSLGLLRRKDQTVWLLVGAPRANITGFSRVIEPGALYKCEIESSRQSCKVQILDFSQNTDLLFENIRTSRNYGWAGASIDTADGEAIACAPRFKTGAYTNIKYITGLCYKMNTDWKKSPKKIFPMPSSRDYSISYYGKLIHYYSHGQGGMSVCYPKNSKTVLVGGPGVFNWQGMVGEAELHGFDLMPGESRRRRSVYDHRFWAPSPAETASISDFSYLGYSIASGEFQKGETYHASGAPRANRFFGMVLLFKLHTKTGVRGLRIEERRYGTQIGELFGASLAATDLNGDGVDDLIVGAPLHAHNERKEVGCIYVFLASERSDLRKQIIEAFPTQVLVDGTAGSRFGSAIGTPGDLNGDGYEDVLVGAPYENNDGAVYVFNGDKEGIRSKYTQKISPEEHFPGTPMKGFGVSFSRPLDIDKNYYPDIAVGSFMSNHAAILYTRPVILLNGVISSPGQLKEGEELFVINACSIFYGLHGPNKVEVKIFLEISGLGLMPGSVAFSANGQTTIEQILSLGKGEETCTTHSISIVQTNFIYRDPLEISMKQELWLSPQINGTVKAPVADPRQSLVRPIQVSFITGCEDDGVPSCTTSLEYSVEFKHQSSREPIVIGRQDSVTLVINVMNTAEPAFYPNLTLTVEKNIQFSPIARCTESLLEVHRTLVCQLENPIKEKDQIQVELILTHLSEQSQDSLVNLTLKSASDEELNPLQDVVFPLTFSKDVKIQVSGLTDPEQVFYERTSKDEFLTNATYSFMHRSTISKIGDTPVNQVKIRLLVPTEVMNEFGEYFQILNINETKLLFYGQPQNFEVRETQLARIHAITDSRTRNLTEISCRSGFFKCHEIISNVGPWRQRIDAASLDVKMLVNMEPLSKIIGPQNGTVIVSELTANVVVDEGVLPPESWSVRRNIDIILKPSALSDSQAIPFWVYILGILGGVILVILLSYGLYKVGFFKRKDRDNMMSHQANIVQSSS